MANGGVSLSSLLQGSAKEWAAKDLAEKVASEKKKEGIFGGLKALFKPLAALGSKGLMTLAGIGSGGVLAPLVAALGTSGISKVFDFIGREGFKAGGDPSKIKATGQYGYGKKTAKTFREGLEQSIEERNPFSIENILGDVAMSYVSALTPKIVPKTEIIDGKEVTKYTLEGGDLGKSISSAWKDKDLSKLSLFDLQEEGLIPEMMDIKGRKAMIDLITTTEGVAPDTSDIDEEIYKQLSDSSPVGAEYTEIGGIKSQYTQPDELPYSPYDFLMPERSKSSLDTSSILQGFQLPQSGSEQLQQTMDLRDRLGFKKQGGLIPKYYGGGSVSDSPTIADYFDKQGVSLGGSNTQSLSERLGRR